MTQQVKAGDLTPGDTVVAGFVVGSGFDNIVIAVERNGDHVTVTWPGNNTTVYRTAAIVTIERR